jgi:hypothetical protein
VAFNNADRARELRILLNGTPIQKAADVTVLLGAAKAKLAGNELRISMPAQSLTIFAMN